MSRRTPNPEITVIIPNWNGAAFLKPCLDSVLNQSGVHIRILVVDNASTDESRDILESYKHLIACVELSTNVGFARAMNAGLAASKTDLLFILNNDTVLEADCLARLVHTVAELPEYGFYAPEIRHIADREKLWAAGLMYSDRCYGNRSGRHLLAGKLKPTEVFGACGAAALFKKSVLMEVGFFNEDFFVYQEDVELSLRHQLMGHRCLYVPGALVYHHGSGTLRKSFGGTVEQKVRNALVTLLTCVPQAILRKYARQTIGFYLRLSLRLIRRGYFWPWLQGILGVLLRAPELLTRRKHLQSSRTVDIGYLDSLLYRGPIEVNFPEGVVYL